MIFVSEKYFAIKARQKEYSLTRYSIRLKRDSYLHDGFVDFVTKHDTSLEHLVNKLLNNQFSAKWQSDV